MAVEKILSSYFLLLNLKVWQELKPNMKQVLIIIKSLRLKIWHPLESTINMQGSKTLKP